MKTIIAVFILTFSSVLTSNAQIYVQGGLNLANITNNNGDLEDNNVLPTFNVGLLGRAKITPMFALESGALFTGRGSKAYTYFNGGNDYVKTTFNPLYIEVPVNAVIKIPLENESNVFFNAGPYMAIGVGGKSRSESKFGPLTSSSSQTIEFSNDDPFTSEEEDAGYNKLKRFDYGINIGGGFQFKYVILKANFGIGLTKINSTESNDSENNTNKYRTLSFSVGFPLTR